MDGFFQNICIMGTGGVGGYFGGKIARMIEDTVAREQVHFVARGAHLEQIRKNGLVLNTDEESGLVCRPSSATDSVGDLPGIDLCLLCVKSYDLDDAVKSMLPLLTPQSIILPLLNGVDVYDRIRRITGEGFVMPACVYVGTHIERPGMITQKGGTCTIHFGPDPEKGSFRKDDILNLFVRSSIKYQWLEDPRVAIWGKYMFIAPFGLVTAAYDRTIGEVMASEELRGVVESLMKELHAVSLALNIPLPPDIVTASLAKGNTFPRETRTSFQRDVETPQKRNEGDLFGGTIIRYGKELGIATPDTAGVYSRIEMMHDKKKV